MRDTTLMTVSIVCAIALMTVACASSDKPVGTPLQQIWEKPAQTPSDSVEPQTMDDKKSQPLAIADPTSAAEPGAESMQAESVKVSSEPDEILAYINGQPITRAEVVDLLVASHGLGILEHLILLNAARQRAADMSLVVTQKDIDAAHSDALRRLATPIGGPDTNILDEQTAERLLQAFLSAKNISQREWALRMEQRAYLAKIARAEVAKMTVTEQMLRAEYERAYGEKAQVRHIQVGSLAEATRVRPLLAEKDFELVARQHSENEFTASHGGLMPPFTRNDPDVPPLICEMAFSLAVGQISPTIQEQGRYHIIRLERRFPASDVGFENVNRDVLRKCLLDRLTDQRMVTLEGELFQSAAVDIRDKTLDKQFRQRHRPVAP